MMDKKDAFKEFVKKNPKLINYVKDGNSSWQKFYELYDLYGEDNSAWKEYLTPAVKSTPTTNADLVNWLKGVNLDEFQNGINSIQRVLGLLGDLTTKKTTSEEYKPRPVYKHFED